MSSKAANKKYLKSIMDKITPIPREMGIQVAVQVFFDMLYISTTESGFDSGQAAANWRLEGFSFGADYGEQKMLWGYNDPLFGEVSPTNPVGYKSLRSNNFGGMYRPQDVTSAGAPGNPDRVYAAMADYATMQAVQMPKDVSVISVYNPIEPGFVGFNPGSDEKYEANALDRNRMQLPSVIASAISNAETVIKSRFEAAR